MDVLQNYVITKFSETLSSCVRNLNLSTHKKKTFSKQRNRRAESTDTLLEIAVSFRTWVRLFIRTSKQCREFLTKGWLDLQQFCSEGFAGIGNRDQICGSKKKPSGQHVLKIEPAAPIVGDQDLSSLVDDLIWRNVKNLRKFNRDLKSIFQKPYVGKNFVTEYESDSVTKFDTQNLTFTDHSG